jgi:hypothetical protein
MNTTMKAAAMSNVWRMGNTPVSLPRDNDEVAGRVPVRSISRQYKRRAPRRLFPDFASLNPGYEFWGYEF